MACVADSETEILAATLVKKEIGLSRLMVAAAEPLEPPRQSRLTTRNPAERNRDGEPLINNLRAEGLRTFTTRKSSQKIDDLSPQFPFGMAGILTLPPGPECWTARNLDKMRT